MGWDSSIAAAAVTGNKDEDMRCHGSIFFFCLYWTKARLVPFRNLLQESAPLHSVTHSQSCSVGQSCKELNRSSVVSIVNPSSKQLKELSQGLNWSLSHSKHTNRRVWVKYERIIFYRTKWACHRQNPPGQDSFLVTLLLKVVDPFTGGIYWVVANGTLLLLLHLP